MPNTLSTLSAPAAAAALPLANAQSGGCGNASPPAGGVRTMQVNGKEREYTLYVPETYSAETQHKLIFGYHWLNGNMDNVVEGAYYGLEPLAAGSAIFVAPNGLNAGWANEGGEDLMFTDQIIEEVEAELCIDQTQRYATGFSYGGGMTYAVACARADIFTAVAPIAGAELSGCEGGTDPIPYLGIHGVVDSVLSIDMGRSIRDTFIANNGCSGEELPEPAAGSGEHVKTEYTCTSDPVVWIAHSGDHIPNPDFAPEETWSFWEQFFNNDVAAPAPSSPAGGNSTIGGGAPAPSSAAPVPLPSPSGAMSVLPVASSAAPAAPAVPEVEETPEVPEAGEENCEVVYV